jgi:phage shock protein B
MQENIMGMLIGGLAIVILFLGLPWLIFHYVTRWKTAATLTNEDEKLMEELYGLARRLDERMCTLERIMTAENPNWRAIACDPIDDGLGREIGGGTVSNQPARRIGQ